MWFKFISFLKFLFKSKNEHGVHSPFVFGYVTQCLYSKQKFNQDKTADVLLKSIGYFNIKTLYINENPDLEELVKAQYPDIRPSENTVDLLFTKHLDAYGLDRLLSSGKLHNDSMILIDSIHEDPVSEHEWKNLIESSNITVSMDLFHCGVLFVRKEQVKEHFTIRI